MIARSRFLVNARLRLAPSLRLAWRQADTPPARGMGSRRGDGCRKAREWEARALGFRRFLTSCSLDRRGGPAVEWRKGMVNVLWVSLALQALPVGGPTGIPDGSVHAPAMSESAATPAPKAASASQTRPQTRTPASKTKQGPAASESGAELDALCNRLLDQARLIDSQLRGVTDLASADQAADQLNVSMDQMLILLRSLEDLPPANADQAQRMSHKLNDLVRISQNYMALVARITEVNAYGSDRLLKVFAKYKVLDFGSDAEGRETALSQQAELLEEMGDRLEDVLYLVRKVQDKPSAQAAVQGLSPTVTRLENLRRRIDAQAGAIAASRGEDVRKSMQRLRRLQGELRQQSARLKDCGYYDVPVMEVRLRDCERCCL